MTNLFSYDNLYLYFQITGQKKGFRFPPEALQLKQVTFTSQSSCELK